MKEVIEMVQDLLTMKPNTYMKCKLVLLSVSREYPKDYELMKAIFSYTDRHRPLLIGCTGDGGKEGE